MSQSFGIFVYLVSVTFLQQQQEIKTIIKTVCLYSGLVEGVIIIQTNDPAVCAGATPPECPTGNSQQRPGGQGGQGGQGGHGNPFGIPPGLNKPKN